MVNLLKLLNKRKYLDNLEKIEDLYDSNVDFIEELISYHKMKEKLLALQNEVPSSNFEEQLSENSKENVIHLRRVGTPSGDSNFIENSYE